ncbi:MAG: ATP-binding protein [Candidatus Poribacteria bacterium]|nr:ATP-binding protein [Candidatus Poribacteria bacterium]
MNHDIVKSKQPYRMEFDVGTIKHLGLQMYSTLPPIIGELVANAWDANATKVEITIPEGQINEQTSEIIIKDNGFGMSDQDIRSKYLIIGRDRRQEEQSEETPPPHKRRIMGRKGIGKFSAFGIAKEIVIESVKNRDISHFQMNYDELLKNRQKREIEFPPLKPTGTVSEGTKITLRYITKFKTRSISIDIIRRGLARRFAVIGAKDFEVVINGEPISPEDRDLKRLLAKDVDGNPYLWEYNKTEIKDETGWTVSGWIGALSRTSPGIDKIDRGIVLMARGKLVQEPFVFDAVVGQQFALSYLIGELHVDFVDEEEDTIATTRNSLVWDTEANAALKEWGKDEVNKKASLWAKRRSEDNRRKLKQHPLYIKFKEQADEIDKKLEFEKADRLIQQLILQSTDKNPDADIDDFESLVEMFIDFWKFDSFQDMAAKISESGIEEPGKLLNLFRQWEVLEAKEMMKVTQGRIATIKELHNHIETNALEVPTLHNFLKKFPWVIDPRWTLVADERKYSDLLRDEFPESDTIPEVDRRIDFLCVSERTHLIVVEIKRPQSRISMKELDQIFKYVTFIDGQIRGSSDPDFQYTEVSGYLFCGDVVDDREVQATVDRLALSKIYVRYYADLLKMAEQLHTEFLERYNELQKVKQRTDNNSYS